MFFVIFLIIASGSTFQVDKLQSTKIGFRLHFTTHKAVEIIENAGIITSEPFLRLSDFKATSKAAVPLETAIPYFLKLNLENFFSKSLTNLPSDEIQLVLKNYKIFFFQNYII